MYYKVLGPGGKPCNGGNGKWSLPHGDKPGRWMPKIDNIEPCIRGYHLCERGDVIIWLGDEIYEAEGRGESIRHEDKTVFEEARLLRKLDKWDKKLQLLFIADCKEHVLRFFMTKYPNESGNALFDEIGGAIWTAVTWAPGVAWMARAAVGAETWVPGTAWVARAGVGDAINKEKDWQTDRLFELLGESYLQNVAWYTQKEEGKMKLYLISQDKNSSYDTYDSAVVAAPDAETARAIHPQTGKIINWKKGLTDSWCSSSEYVNVRYIGEAAADVKQGVICASFNPG